MDTRNQVPQGVRHGEIWHSRESFSGEACHAVTALEVTAWGLVGFVIAGGLHIAVQRSSILPAETGRLAPPGLLETITAVLFASLALRIGAEPDLLAYSWLAVVGILLAAIDWNSRQLPTKLLWTAGIILAALFGTAALVSRDAYPLIRSATSMLVLLTFYGTLYILRPGQLGGGDVRLGGLLGLALGWAGWPVVLAGTLFGWLAAAIAFAVLRLIRRTARNREVPLGPFLFIGALASLLASSAI